VTAPPASRTLPQPRTPHPGDAPPLRWGVLGPGSIASSFAESLALDTRQTVQAVGSRSLDRARAFADRFGAATAYGSYEALVADPDVDVVYVASPHSEHRAHALLALDAGKPVLVEKAFTRSAAEAEEVVAAARAGGLFAMEAMWTRFLPHIDVVRQVLEQGLLGEIVAVFADHGQNIYPDGPERLSSPDLAGGALLDLGVYPVSFASMVLGPFSAVSATATLTDLGVDAQTACLVTSETGAQGALHCTMAAKTPTSATICGTQARLELDGEFYAPTTVRLVASDGTLLDTYDSTTGSDFHGGLRYEAVEVARCLSEGLLESPLLPLEETLAVMRAMDEARRQTGVRYPGE
jgi:predicted dehydrogenase